MGGCGARSSAVLWHAGTLFVAALGALVAACWIVSYSLLDLQPWHLGSGSLTKGLNLGLLHWQCEVSATGRQGRSCGEFFLCVSWCVF